MAASASAAPLAHLEQDVDGDGKVDKVSIDASGDLVIQGAARASLTLKPQLTQAELVAAVVRGAPMIAAHYLAKGIDETAIYELRGGVWVQVLRQPTGPVPPDGDYNLAILPAAAGIYRFQQRAGFHRCDGKPALLFAEGWTGTKFQRLAKLPVDVAETAPVLIAKPDGQPAAAPLLYQAREASYEVGAENASALPLPTELDDGKPATAWREELTTIGEGQFFTYEPRAANAKAYELRFAAAALKGTQRLRRVAVVGANAAFHVELADIDGAQSVELPQPIEGCVSVIVERAYGPGMLAIGDLSVYGEGERSGGGEAVLAHTIAEGGDVKTATQALARRGAAAAHAIDDELQKAKSAGARTRLVRALASLRDPAAAPLLEHAITRGQVEDAELDATLAAMGQLGFAQELHDLIAKKELPVVHRAASARALAVALTLNPKADPTLLIDLAGDGSADERKAVIEGLSRAPVSALLPAAHAATAPEAAGDLYRAATRHARTTAAEVAPVVAAYLAALATATDYERRYRLVDGMAALGDKPALDQVAALLESLPAGSARFALDQVGANAIAKAPRAEALDLLLFLLREPDAGVRYAALTALGASESGPAGPWHAAVHADGIDRVIQTALVSDTWPEVRARAAQMLGARCSRPGPATSLADSVHRDPEVAVRNDALSALAECRATGAGDLLAKTWDNQKQPLELRQHAVDLTVELADRTTAVKLLAKFRLWQGAALESTEALALTQSAAYAIGRLAPPGAGDALLAGLDDGGISGNRRGCGDRPRAARSGMSRSRSAQVARACAIGRAASPARRSACCSALRQVATRAVARRVRRARRDRLHEGLIGAFMSGALRAIRSRMLNRLLLSSSLMFAAAACGSNATDIGDVTVGTQSYHVEREGAEPAAGVSTQLVFKPNDGVKPDSIYGWVGLADVEDSAKVLAVYDPNDGDFDDDVTCPSPLPAGSLIYFDVTKDGVTNTGSIAIK